MRQHVYQINQKNCHRNFSGEEKGPRMSERNIIACSAKTAAAFGRERG